MIINKTFTFHTYLGGKKKNQFALLDDALSERVSIQSIELDRLLDLRILYLSFIKRTCFEESDQRVSVCEQLCWCAARLPL